MRTYLDILDLDHFKTFLIKREIKVALSEIADTECFVEIDTRVWSPIFFEEQLTRYVCYGKLSELANEFLKKRKKHG